MRPVKLVNTKKRRPTESPRGGHDNIVYDDKSSKVSVRSKIN